ncbi:MAG: hypothetical protein ACTSWR_00185 [Candidatus Helarchaeota archaeon]
MLNPVDLKGDWIKNQAKFCLCIENTWAFSESIVNQWIKMIKKLKIDGIIFNDITRLQFYFCCRISFKKGTTKNRSANSQYQF